MKINRIDDIRTKDVETIEINYDNLGILKICKYLLGVVVNDIEYMNDMENDYMNDYDLGNNTYIKREDLDSIEYAIEKLQEVEEYNR